MTSGYAFGQLRQALQTATSAGDDATRARAVARAGRWLQAMESMRDGSVAVGSRTPADGLPAWVTLEVLRGGFATGSARAAGPLEPDELALATRLKVPARRELLFAHYLSDAGLTELSDMLDSGRYLVDLPEDAALLAVAWLLRTGLAAQAWHLIDEIGPYAHLLRFAPRVAEVVGAPPDHVHRSSVDEARRALADRRTPAAIARQHEALTIWAPFTDRMLGLWWRRHHDGSIDVDVYSTWPAEAAALLGEYETLAARHTACTKHRNPKQNLAILVGAAREALGGDLTARRSGMVARVVADMVAKRGEPGSSALTGLRDVQRTVAAAPSHASLARAAAARLPRSDQRAGLARPSYYTGPLRETETAVGEPGTAMPAVVGRVLSRTRSAPIETLLADGVVPSAEVLAELQPAITASAMAAAYDDTALGRLMAANYRAFRDRRSLLLLNLEKQVRLDELPWVAATQSHSGLRVDVGSAALRRLGSLYLENFPSTIVPNPLVQEFVQLADASALAMPFTEELAVDIFMGEFSDKFARATVEAAKVLGGSLYAAYYGVDYPVLSAALTAASAAGDRGSRWHRRKRRRTPDVPTAAEVFTAECVRRAGGHDRWSMGSSGSVIEQSQILTSHNLAALVTLGAAPSESWRRLAEQSLEAVTSHLDIARDSRRPLPRVKDAAYALRQAVFFLSMLPRGEALSVVREWPVVDAPAGLPAVHGGLLHVALGGRFDESGRCPGGRRFTGWTIGPAWVLQTAPT